MADKGSAYGERGEDDRKHKGKVIRGGEKTASAPKRREDEVEPHPAEG
jgi:hypothetical protein